MSVNNHSTYCTLSGCAISFLKIFDEWGEEKG